MGSLDKFVEKMTKLLELERQEEIQERSETLATDPSALQRKGVCLTNLVLSSTHTGLYGRTVIELEPFWPPGKQGTKQLPAHRFSSGVAADLYAGNDQSTTPIASGIVSKVTSSSVSVAFESLDLEWDGRYRLLQTFDEVTYKGLKRALEDLGSNKAFERPGGVLVNILFGMADLGPPLSIHRDGEKARAKAALFNASLDHSQQEAVEFALRQRELAIVHGPPGTGKTTTVVEIIRQAVKRDMKILVCAPSNIAVDNVVERLAASGTRCVRLGHPARLLPAVLAHCLDARILHSDEGQLVRDVKKELDAVLRKLGGRGLNPGERRGLRDERGQLQKELRQREAAARARVFDNVDVVLCTLSHVSTKAFPRHLKFDLVVIDECSQALEIACWPALLQAPRCVLAGDHLQLPPVIHSDRAEREGLGLSLMERAINELPGRQSGSRKAEGGTKAGAKTEAETGGGAKTEAETGGGSKTGAEAGGGPKAGSGTKAGSESVVRMLTVQYRMHQSIMASVAGPMYDGKLTAHESVAAHLLKDLPNITDCEDTAVPLLLIDTAGCNLLELDIADEFSKGNEGEADVVAHYVEQLVAHGLPAKDIAVITPYNLQVELLRLRLHSQHPTLEIKTVDGFQGREKEAVIISFVRANEKGQVGFLNEKRINVAVTRARRHLVVVCDSDTVSNHEFMATFIDYVTEEGEVRSAQMYIDAGALKTTTERPSYLDSQLEKTQQKKSTAEATSQKKKTKPGSADKQKQKQNNTKKTDDKKESKKAEGNKTDKKVETKESTKETETNKVTKNESRITEEVRDDTEQTEQEPSSVDEITDSVEHVTLEDTIPKRPESSKKKKRAENRKAAYEKEKEKEKKKPEKAPKPPKAKKGKSALEKASEDDFDALIEAAQQENSFCNFSGCKERSSLLGQNCGFCSQRFCLSHHIPEVHGCGDAARASARKMICRDGVLYQGSGRPDKKPDQATRNYLHRKLEKKVGELESNRKPKKKEKS